jgi:hypothetical protein
MPIALSPQEALPGFATAFDEEAMKGYLQAALFGTHRPGYLVERCTPTRPLYVPGESCLLRYRFQARSSTSSELLEPIVTGRVFPNRKACAAYLAERLAPLVERVRDRPELAAFVAPAAMIDPLNMVVCVWPIDGELPTLVEATDRVRMIEVFRETLPEALEQQLVVHDCEIELVSYRRRQRCVLRYTVAGKPAGRDEVRRLIVYGKVSAVGNETPKDLIIDALRRRILEQGAPYRFTVPRSFGWRPDLQLSLLEALPGDAQIGAALEARLRGEPRPKPPLRALWLEEMVARCGHVAAALHTSGLTIGPARTLEDELAGLQREIEVVRPFARELGDRAHAWLGQIAALAEQSEPLRHRLSHGDFKHEQLLFDGATSALVDFDAICQAEPALDLGKFVAHLEVEARRIQQRASVSSPLGKELVERFLCAYVRAASDRQEGEPQLRRRTAVYEAVALVRLVLRSEQDLAEMRVQLTTELLEARISSIAREREQR